ncbi:MAG: hypothetical protein HYZ28_24470 [Myxococcales bacterium]|nr:hypothetical protein [Myxococcales bacterium]
MGRLAALLLASLALGCPGRKAGTCEQDAHCPKGQRCCGGACKDLMADPENCGNCGAACSAVNASPACVAGACQLTCNSSSGNCNNDPRDGCETSLLYGLEHCGACGKACYASNASGVCSQGSCGMGACNLGYADCDKKPQNGCEVDTRSSPVHCGECSRACAPANATGMCRSGSCLVAQCNTGFGDCNQTASDGCETDLSSSAAHCGACAAACGQGQSCVATKCVSRDLLLFGGTADLQTGAPVADVFRFSLDSKAFSQLNPSGIAPEARMGHLAAWDTAGNRMLVWGGSTSAASWDTRAWALEFSGEAATWKELPVLDTPPAARAGAASAWDGAGRKLYVFGGFDSGNSALGDLWAFDAASLKWAQLHGSGAPGAPSPRGVAAAAYDAVEKKLALFGGFTGASELGDLWVLDPAAATPTWTQLSLAGGPGGRLGHQFFDGARPLQLFGGLSGLANPTPLGDLFTLNLGPSPSWKAESAVGPSPRFYFSAAAVGPRRIVFGGATLNGFSMDVSDDLWAYDASNGSWTELSADGAASAPSGKALGTVVARQ